MLRPYLLIFLLIIAQPSFSDNSFEKELRKLEEELPSLNCSSVHLFDEMIERIDNQIIKTRRELSTIDYGKVSQIRLKLKEVKSDFEDERLKLMERIKALHYELEIISYILNKIIFRQVKNEPSSSR